jgi:hypothetical protein
VAAWFPDFLALSAKSRCVEPLPARQFAAARVLSIDLAMHSSQTPLAPKIKLSRLDIIDEV